MKSLIKSSMKWVVLFLFILSSVSSANIRYGLTGVSDGGAGFIAKTENFSAAVRYAMINRISGVKGEDKSHIEFNLNHKTKLDDLNQLSLGVRYLLLNVKEKDDDDSDENKKVAVTIGIEHQFSNHIFAFFETDIYANEQVDDGADEESFFHFSRVGLSYIF